MELRLKDIYLSLQTVKNDFQLGYTDDDKKDFDMLTKIKDKIEQIYAENKKDVNTPYKGNSWKCA